jgi:hypothetical protein
MLTMTIQKTRAGIRSEEEQVVKVVKAVKL